MAAHKGLSHEVVESLQARGYSSGRISEVASLVADLESHGLQPTKVNPIGTVNPEVQISTIVDEAALANLFKAVSASSSKFNELRILTHGIPPVYKQFLATFSA